MSEGFDKLKEIGAQKIHEKTHITKEHVQAILHDSFESMDKVQFLGFVSILERDYNVKLGDLKIKGLDYFLNLSPDNKQNNSVFMATKSKTKHTPYIIMALLVLIIAAFFILNKTSSAYDSTKAKEIDNDAIENVKNNLLPEVALGVEVNSSDNEQNSSISDVNVSEENTPTEDENMAVANASSVDGEANKEIEPKVQGTANSFKIMPKKMLWMAYIDLKKNKEYQKLFLEEFSLDPSKVWLLNLGHGNTKFEINGKVLEYNSTKNLKFLYQDNNFTEISTEKFNSIKNEHKW